MVRVDSSVARMNRIPASSLRSIVLAGSGVTIMNILQMVRAHLWGERHGDERICSRRGCDSFAVLTDRAECQNAASPHRLQPGRIERSARAVSRSRNFWIFPVEVLRSSTKIAWRGSSRCARCWRHQSSNSSFVALLPARNSTRAQAVSPSARRVRQRPLLLARRGACRARLRPRSKTCSRHQR